MSIWKCQFCGKVFSKEVGKRTYEIKCPKCREIDVEYVGEKVVREVVRDGKWASR